MIKLWMDTDIGGDVDDAIALTAALRLEEVELIGISTVYLRPYWRAQIAAELIRRIGAKPVPMGVGCDKPLSGHWEEIHIKDTGVLPPEALPVSEKHGADLLLRAVRQNPDMTILAIGPLTNIGVALMKDAEAFKNCHFYIMSGRLHNAQPEWNTMCDPEAMKLLLDSGCDVKLVSFDFTQKSQFTQAEVDAFTGTPFRDYLRDMMNLFTERFGFLPMMHDPMALAMLVEPEMFRMEKHRIAVELRGELTRGSLVDYGPDENSNVTVVTDVDLPAFMQWITDLMMNG